MAKNGGERSCFPEIEQCYTSYKVRCSEEGRLSQETAGHVEKSTAGMRRENIQETVVSSLEPKYNFMCFRDIAR